MRVTCLARPSTRPLGQPLPPRPARHGDVRAPPVPPVGPQTCRSQTYCSPWQCPLPLPYFPVQNSSPPSLRSPTFPHAEAYGETEQHRSTAGRSPERWYFALSPADKQGWAPATPRDESKRRGRASSLSFWHVPVSRVPPGRGQPLAQPQCSAQRDQPGWTPRQRHTFPALHPQPAPRPTRSPGDLPSHPSTQGGASATSWSGARFSQTQRTETRRQMGAAASKFSVCRGSVFIKSCRSPARTGVSHSKISWQLFNLKAQEFDIRPKKGKKKKKSIVSNFSARHLAYSRGKRKVKRQKERKTTCIRHCLCAAAAQPPQADISPSPGDAQSRSAPPTPP